MPSIEKRPRRAGIRPAAITGLAALLFGVGGGCALRTLLAPAPEVLDSPAYTLVAAQEGTVGHSLRLNTTAEWQAETTLLNQAAGIITSRVWQAGDTASAGSIIYTVDLRPVVVAAGDVPAFRDLHSGARGEDVTQLQELLVSTGHYAGAADGVFGYTTERAVRAWQRDLGLVADGVVRRGDVLFVPSLPARLALEPDLVIGATVSPGDPAVRVLRPAPQFTIALPEGQSRLVSTGMEVEILREGDDRWWTTIVDLHREEDATGAGGVTAVLRGGGEAVCGDECGELPIEAPTLLPSLIHVVPETEGVTVPAAAIVTSADGATLVHLADGRQQPVTVLAAASGIAVVDGLTAGTLVRTPGQSTRDDS